MSIVSSVPTQSSRQFTEKLFSNHFSKRFPWSGQWELTCRCNLKCVMCYTDCFNTPERIRRELSTGEIFRILGELHEAGCMEITFTGGEPFSRSDFKEIYERARHLGFLLTLFTNGTLMNEETADWLARHPPQRVEISLHGISAGVFDEVTQISGSFGRCLKAIKLLRERQIPLVLKTVGLTANQNEILAIKRYAGSLGEGVEWRFGQYLRDNLARDGDPFRYQLSEGKLQEIEREDPTLWQAKCDEVEKYQSITGCSPKLHSFHIDAYGQLQICSNNRLASYDLRKGSFREGFYEVLPTFSCPRRVPAPDVEPALASPKA